MMNRSAITDPLLRVYACIALCFVASCSYTTTIAPSVMAGVEKGVYVAPKNYAEHRVQQKFYTTDTDTIAYTDNGTGNVLVLLHGVPTSSWLYRKVIPELQKSYRVISVDFLGYGSSDKPVIDGDNYSIEAQTQRVHQLLQHLGVKQFSMMMHDMGGLIGWEMLHRYPNQVQHLVILDTIVTEKGFKHPNLHQGMSTKVITDAYSADLTSQAVITSSLRYLGLKGKRKLTDVQCQGYVIPMKEGSNHALYAFFTSMNRSLFQRLDRYQKDLKNFKGRSLVLWGGEDPVLTTEQIPYLQKHLRIPDAQIHIYPDHSHFVPEELPQEIIKHVREFIPR